MCINFSIIYSTGLEVKLIMSQNAFYIYKNLYLNTYKFFFWVMWTI